METPAVPNSMTKWVKIIIGVIMLGIIVYGLVVYFTNRGSTSTDTLSHLSDPLNTTSSTTIQSTQIPPSTEGSYNVQLWTIVKEWSYRYGDEKSIVVRKDTSGNVNPEILFHPTDNQIIVRVSHFPLHQKSVPPDAPSPAIQRYECHVPNIPLQSWFSLSLGISNKNLDVYINGKLMKSCVIPGVPVGMSTNATIAESGGYSGQMSNLVFSNTMLTPDMAFNFFQTGPSAKTGANTPTNSWNPLSKYTMKFSVLDDTTEQAIKTFTF